MSALVKISDEEREIVETVRRFVERDVRPNVERLEREKEFPARLVSTMKELGLFGIAVPQDYDGLGLRLPVFAQVLDVLAGGWTTLAAYVNSHSTVAYAISKHGTLEQKQRYLPMMAAGEHRGALCLTEPEAGSDLQSIKTVARTDGDSFVLSGQKIFVTNGEKATLVLTLSKGEKIGAKGKPVMNLFLLEKATEGVSVTSHFHKMAYGQVDTVEIVIDKARIGKEQLLGGEEDKGFAQLMDALELGRIAIAASAVGLGAAALSEAQRYASVRKAFGTSIDKHQAVQLRSAEMATKLVAARLLTAEAAEMKDQGGRSDMLSGMAKLFASETCLEIVEGSLRTHGGYGYISEFPIERYYREAPLYIVGEGTNDIQKVVIARRMSGPDEMAYLGLIA